MVPNDNLPKVTRHESRFGIKSFIYRARRPFHPGRLNDLLLEPYFMLSFLEDEKEEKEEEEEEGNTKTETKMSEEDKMIILQARQRVAAAKQNKRAPAVGELLRSKGFIWIASSHNTMGGWQQAGNVIRLEPESPWMCKMREVWEGTPSEEHIMKNMKKPNGEEWPYGDRRQELVFIGQSLKHECIQNILDQCLLNDEEMQLGPEKWEETMAAKDIIKLSLYALDRVVVHIQEVEEDDENMENGEAEPNSEEDNTIAV